MAQNMNQANIGLLGQWRAAGNTGDLPVGWTGTGGSSSNSSSSGTPDFSSFLSKYQDTLNQKDQQRQQAFNTQVQNDKNDVTSFLTNYKTDTGNAISSTSAKYNLPGQMDIVNGLNTRISTLRGNTDNAGAGGFANAGQVDSAVNSRYLPQYTTAMSNLNTSAGLADKEVGQLTAPDVAAGDAMKTRIASEMTGFTAEQNGELEGILKLLESGTTLTQDQADRAEKLAEANLSYQAKLAEIAGAQKTEQIKQTYIPVAAGASVYNPYSGQSYTAP